MTKTYLAVLLSCLGLMAACSCADAKGRVADTCKKFKHMLQRDYGVELVQCVHGCSRPDP